jgi:hypothetical protein
MVGVWCDKGIGLDVWTSAEREAPGTHFLGFALAATFSNDCFLMFGHDEIVFKTALSGAKNIITNNR